MIYRPRFLMKFLFRNLIWHISLLSSAKCGLGLAVVNVERDCVTGT